MNITVRNFQSLQLVSIEAEGLTVITGPSNLGKSALIRAVSSAFFGRAGDDFVRRNTSQTSVLIEGAPTADGGTMDVEWFKGKGVNYFVIDGEKYDKVNRDVPVHLEKAGYRDILIGDEYIRPQVSEQFSVNGSGNLFLLDRPGSFVHDVIAEASRLSVLLRADKECSADLKRQKSLLKIRIGDLEIAQERLKKLEPIKEMHGKVHGLKPRVSHLVSFNNRVQDIKSVSSSRAILLPVTKLELPKATTIDVSPFNLADKILEVRKLLQEKKSYSSLPQNVPSSKPIDFSGLLSLNLNIEEAKQLAKERTGVLRTFRECEVSFKSISQELGIVKAELDVALHSIEICPVCLRPMEKIA